MDSRAAEQVPRRRPFPVATVLGVALLVLASGTGAWVVWQLTADGRAPAAFRERATLPQCGPITVAQGQPVPESLQDCLLSSEARREGAEVVVTSSTDEGDPIRTYYRVLPGGGVEIFTDATADSYGPGEWSWTQCPDVAAVETWESCEPARRTPGTAE